MLLILLAVIYITFICFIWGKALCRFFCIITKWQSINLHFSVTCLSGLALLTALASWWSLCYKFNTPFLHLIILGFTVLFIIQDKEHYKEVATNWKWPVVTASLRWLVLLLVSLLFMMGAWHIIHPDTLEYHAAIIQSTLDKGVVKGYAQQNVRYGLQSSWFISEALFSFHYHHTTFITFTNITAAFWFILFVVQKTRDSFFENANRVQVILWLLLLIFALADYPQLRLTITSASPDFSAAMYVWTAFYLFLQKDTSPPVFLLLFLLCCTAFTIKLSVIPILFFGGYLLVLLNKEKLTYLLLGGMMGSLIMLPLLLRNLFTSGYVLFPSIFPDIFNTAWKLPQPTLHYIQAYVTAYARAQVPGDAASVSEVMQMKWNEWIPIWWSFKSIPQKIMLASFPLLVVWNSFHIKQWFNLYYKTKIIFILSFIGVVFWFWLAPDLRFGLAFFIPVMGILLYNLLTVYLPSTINLKVISGIIICINVVVLLYILYRFVYFFDVVNFIVPYGV